METRYKLQCIYTVEDCVAFTKKEWRKYTAMAWISGLSEKKGQNGMFSMLPFVSVCRNASYTHTHTHTQYLLLLKRNNEWKDEPKTNNKIDNYRRERRG